MSSRLLLEIRRSLRPFLFLLLLVALGVAAFAGIFRNLTFERPWQDYREIRAEFDDVKGVFPGGHQVRINGVKVGIVSKADLVDGRRAVLTLKLEEKWGPIYKNAKLRIRPVTPLQDLYVNITDRGDAASGEATEGDVIAAENTSTPVDISRVLNTFNADTRERLAMLLTELGTGLGDAGGEKLKAAFAEIAPFLSVAEEATEVLARRARNVRRIVHNFGDLSAELAKRDKDLNRFVTEGNATLGQLASDDTELASTFRGIADLLPVMRSSFVSVRDLTGELDPALKSLEPVADELQEGLKGLEDFGKDALPAAVALRPAVNDLRTMARALSPTSLSLRTALGRTAEQSPSYDELTKTIAPCMDMLDEFFNNTLSVLKYETAQGSYPRSAVSIGLDSVGRGAVPGTTRRLATCVDGQGD